MLIFVKMGGVISDLYLCINKNLLFNNFKKNKFYETENHRFSNSYMHIVCIRNKRTRSSISEKMVVLSKARSLNKILKKVQSKSKLLMVVFLSIIHPTWRK